MNRTGFNSPDAPAAAGGYAQSVLVSAASRHLFISGQIPVDVAGAVPIDFVEQARLAWRNLVAQLETAGMSLDDLVKVTIFLSDRRYAIENRQIRQEFLGDREVALTVIITGIFDEAWLLEIEAIAAD
jgi:enamine deaminase RidA (YjgF/YER057c/UK114 family)